MSWSVFESIQLRGLLSFAPDSELFEMKRLNVLIGPNGAGKSNLIEGFELLRSLPTDVSEPIRGGGGPEEWVWKGTEKSSTQFSFIGAIVNCLYSDGARKKKIITPMSYSVVWSNESNRLKIVKEFIANKPPHGGSELHYYSYDGVNPDIVAKSRDRTNALRIKSDNFRTDQSILAQRKDPDNYPQLTCLGERFSAIQTFREWTFGRGTAVRRAQATDLPTDYLLPGGINLALVLAELLHHDEARLNEAMRRFLPRFQRLSVRVISGAMAFYLHEEGLSTPISSLRLSDGTLRFLALLAVLLAPTPPSLLCIEEPEMGLHPDAVSLMAELLVEVSQRTQLVVTTHSDALVSALSAHVDSVVVCENLGAGTVLERLETERLKVWLEKYKLGEIWRMGELGGNP